MILTESEKLLRLAEIEAAQQQEQEKQKQQRKSPFKKFCQVNTDKAAIQVTDWLIKTSPLAYRILQFLVQNMDHYNAIVCSYKVLQDYFSISQVSVARAIKLLKDNKFIFVIKSGTSNIYLINKTLYWNSWGTNYANAKFGVNIIISISEQEKWMRANILKQLQTQRECHLKDVKRLPPISNLLLEKLNQQPKVHHIVSSPFNEITRIPIKLSSAEKSILCQAQEHKQLLELMLS